jgi:hypothetical protein
MGEGIKYRAMIEFVGRRVKPQIGRRDKSKKEQGERDR